MLQFVESTKLEEFDTDTVYGRMLQAKMLVKKNEVSLGLLRLNRLGNLTKKRGERLCRTRRGSAHKGYRNIYRISKQGRKYLAWCNTPTQRVTDLMSNMPQSVPRWVVEELLETDKDFAELVVLKEANSVTRSKYKMNSRSKSVMNTTLAIIVEDNLRRARKNDELQNDLFLARRAEKIALDDKERAISEQIRLLDESFQQSKRIVELTGGSKAASELDDLKLAEQETSNRMGWLAMVRMAKAIQSEGPPQPDQVARDQKQEAARIMVLMAGLLDSMDTQARRLRSLGYTVGSPDEMIAELEKDLQKKDKTIAELVKRAEKAETYEDYMWIAVVAAIIAAVIASGLGAALYLEVRKHRPRQEPVKSAEPVPPWFGSKFRPMT